MGNESTDEEDDAALSDDEDALAEAIQREQTIWSKGKTVAPSTPSNSMAGPEIVISSEVSLISGKGGNTGSEKQLQSEVGGVGKDKGGPSGARERTSKGF